MANIPEIEVFSGINDVPVESSPTEGCNGSALVSRVNALARRENYISTLRTDTIDNEFAVYVDTVNGSDSNDGLTDLTAFATMEKAISILAENRIDDYWWTYIRVRGTINLPIDLRGLQYQADAISASGMVTIEDINGERFTIATEVNDWTVHHDFNFFITGDGYQFINILNADILVNIPSLAVAGVDIEINGCNFIIGENTYSNFLYFGKGSHIFRNNTITNYPDSDPNSAITVAGVDSYLEVYNALNYVNATYGTIIRTTYGAKCLYTPTLTGVTSGSLVAESGSSLIANYYEGLSYNIDNNAYFKYAESPGNHHNSVIYCETVREGQDVILLRANERVHIERITFTGYSGTFTAQLKIGTNLYGTPITLTGDNSFSIQEITSNLITNNSYIKAYFTNVSAAIGVGINFEYAKQS